MTIALAAALVIGEVLTALVIVFFVLIAEVLEELTVERGRQRDHMSSEWKRSADRLSRVSAKPGCGCS